MNQHAWSAWQLVPLLQIHHISVPSIADIYHSLGGVRLLHAIDAADSSLCFWRQRLKQGSHLSFLLLGQGPTSFVLDCVDALRSRLRLGASKQPNATDQIERRVRESKLLAQPHSGHFSTLQGLLANSEIRSDTTTRWI